MFLITGGTGNVGGELLAALTNAGQDVRALTRTARPATLPPGAQAVTGDLDQPDSLHAALDGVQGVFLLPGYQDMPGVLRATRDAGVQRVVLLSGSSAGSGDMTNAISAYMIRSEAAVRDSGVPWTILRPSGFMSNTLRWLPQLQAGNVVLEPFANVPVAVIDPYDIAAVSASALLSPQHEGQTRLLSGPEALLPSDRLRILGLELGRDLRLDAQPNDDARAKMSREMPQEYVDAFFDFYVEGALDDSQVHPAVEEILGRRPRTFQQWAKAHTNAFR
jgi:uncharacterized protein YbjT (DUF2867 family)